MHYKFLTVFRNWSILAVNQANKALQDEEQVKKAKLILEEAAAMLDLKVSKI